MKHFGDITKLSGYELPVVDVITGGSPCQDLSVAGKRAGLDGERSGLFIEQIRIVKEMRENDRRTGRTGVLVRPRYMVWENVPGAFSSNKGADFQAVLTEIVRIAEPEAPDVPMPEKGKWDKSGCLYDELGRWSIAWRVHDAQFWGVPQRRKRISLVADFGGLSAPEILFIRKGLSGNPSESREEGEGTPAGTETCVGKSSEYVKQVDEWVSAVNSSAKHQQDLIQHDLGVARALAPGTHASGSHLTKTLVTGMASPIGTEDSIRSAGIAVDAYNHTVTGDVTASLTCNSNATSTQPTVLQYGIRSAGKCLNSWDVQSKHIQPADGIAESLYAGECRYGGGESYVLDSKDGIGSAISFQERAGKPGGGKGILIQDERTGALSTLNNQAVCTWSLDEQIGNTYVHKDMGNTLTVRSHKQPQAIFCLQGGGETSQKSQGSGINEDVSFTLNALDHHAVAYGIDHVITTGGNCTAQGPCVYEEVEATLKAAGPHAVAYGISSYDSNSMKSDNPRGNVPLVQTYQQVTGTLDCGIAKGTGNQLANQDMFVSNGSIVRRLTPDECASLQGFPRNWCNIGDWYDSKGKLHKDADSPKYKAYGNSIAVGYANGRSGFWCWLARRICAQYERQITMGSLFDGIGGFPLAFQAAGAIPVWASEIEEFPIAVTKYHFPEKEEHE